MLIWHVCKFQLYLCFFLLQMRRQGRRKWVWQGWQVPTQLLSDQKQKEIQLLLTLVELLTGCPPRFLMLPTHLLDDYVPEWWVELVDELSWLFTTRFRVFFILFAENNQILLKISVFPILLTFIHLVALNLVVNTKHNSSSNSTHHCGT